MKKYFDVYPRVFYPSLLIILVFVFVSILGGDSFRIAFSDLSKQITETTGWLFIIGVNIFVVFCFWVAFGKYGNKRLGGKKALPEF